MKLELVRDTSKTFPSIDDPLAYDEIRIHHCRYETIKEIARLQNLERIKISTFPDPSFDFLADLPKVKELNVMHFPRVKDINPLSKLKALEVLELSVLMSSAKNHLIPSLKPLQGLPNLKSVSLHGVIPDDRSLKPLVSCPRLIEFQSGNCFPMEEILDLQIANSEIQGIFFKPIVEIPYSYCKKCNSRKIILSGVTKSAIKCPICNSACVENHITDWNTYLRQNAK